MKKTFVTAALCLAIATPALAGGYAEPVMDPEVIVEAASSGSDAWVVPFMALLVFGTALAK